MNKEVLRNKRVRTSGAAPFYRVATRTITTRRGVRRLDPLKPLKDLF